MKKSNYNKIFDDKHNENLDIDNKQPTEEVDHSVTMVANPTREKTKDVTTRASYSNENKDNRLGEILPNMVIDGYKIGEILHEGSGEAVIRYCRKDEIDYVIKIYRANVNVDLDVYDRLKAINSKNILIPIKTGTYLGRKYEIQPLFRRGTILDNIDMMTPEFIKKVLIPELNETLNEMHKRDLIHNDIKPQNIFLTNDGKSIVLGDFGVSTETGGRAYATNIMQASTLVYSRAQTQGYVSVENDYFQFGMTLNHIANGSDPFKSFSFKKIKEIMATNRWHVSEEIDSNLRSLIILLTAHDLNNQITYEGVYNWLLNNEYHNNNTVVLDYDKKENIDDYQLSNYTIEVNGIKNNYRSLNQVAQVLNNNWDVGLDHFKNGIIHSSLRDLDQATYIKLNEIFDWAMKNEEYDLGLFMTLHYINESIPVVYKGEVFSDIEAFIKYAKQHYYNLSPHILLIPLFKPIFINNLNMFKTIYETYTKLTDFKITVYPNLESRIDETDQTNLDLIKYTKYFNELLTSELKQEEKLSLLMDIFMNIFDRDKNVFYNGKSYDSLERYVKTLFVGLEPFSNGLEENEDFFYTLITNKFNYSEKEVKPIFKEGDLFTKYLKLNDLVNHHQALIINDKQIEDTNDFIVAHNLSFELNEDLSKYKEFIKSNKFTKLNKLYPNKNYDKIIKLDTENENFHSSLYFLTIDDAKFMGHDNFHDLLTTLEQSEQILDDVFKIVDNKNFIYWLNSLKIKNKKEDE